MTNKYRTTEQVIKEKYEDRGWDQDTSFDMRDTSVEQVKPLPLSEEEYKTFALLFSKLALQDQNPELCGVYFELQRRAYYGNRYLPLQEMSEIEQEMWNLGTSEIVESTEKHIR